MLKKTLVAVTLGLTALNAQADVELKKLTGDELSAFSIEYVYSMTQGDTSRNISVVDVTQLSDSDNYYVKSEENGYPFTMLYMKDINSVMIPESGEIYDLTGNLFVSKKYKADIVKEMMPLIKKEDLVTFESTKENATAKHIFVFTDPTCGYCKKLHGEMGLYNAAGITVNYLPFPRGGENNPDGFNALTNALCSADRKEGYNAIKTNKPAVVAEGTTDAQLEDCRNTVRYYTELGSSMGVSGTPAIFDVNGNQLGGYVPAEKLQYLITE